MEASTTPGRRQWKRCILTGNALCAQWWPYPPSIWNSSTSLALILSILTWTGPHGLNVTSVIPPFIYSVERGSHCLLSGISDSFVHFSTVENSKCTTMWPAHGFVSTNTREDHIRIVSANTVQGWIQDFHRRGANPPAGAPTYNFSEKLHKIENIWSVGGAPGSPP